MILPLGQQVTELKSGAPYAALDERSLAGMNESQRSAMRAAMRQALTLIQGPPGTGKTTVAVRILKAWARAAPGTILAASDSNIAVDNIVEGLAKEGVRTIRLGRPETARPELLALCAEEIAAKRVGATGDRSRMTQEEKDRMYDELARVIREADVVCCTAIGAGASRLEGIAFTRVLVDEASQATEYASIVPLCRGTRQFVLSGDQCQLPPVVSSNEAKAGGAELSLFERLVHAGIKPHLLETQYRMHPTIAEFPAQHFYDGQLATGISPSQRPAPPGFRWPDPSRPVCFVAVRGSEGKDGDSTYNEREADEVARCCADLLAGGMQQTEVG